MQQVTTAGITKANSGLDGISWNILGQTYVPKQLSEQLFAWHAEGKLKPLVSQTFALEQAAEAINTLAQRKAVGKLVVKVR